MRRERRRTPPDSRFPPLCQNASKPLHAMFHGRFLVLDDKGIYLIGASIKDLGKNCFRVMKMDATEIKGIKARV